MEKVPLDKFRIFAEAQHYSQSLCKKNQIIFIIVIFQFLN